MRDWFADAFGGAVSDIRQKLIDEAWFGRRPAAPASSHSHGGTDDMNRISGWGDRSHDIGVDR